MIDWIIAPPEQEFEIKKVSGPKESTINIFALLESRDRIAEKIFTEPNIETAQRLMQIRKDINLVINKGL